MRRAGLLALLLVACSNKESAPVPAPEKSDEAKPTAVETKSEAKPEAKPEEKAAPKPEEKADDKAKTAESAKAAPAEAPKDAAKNESAALTGKSSAPNPPNGILKKAEADKLVKVGGRPVVHLLAAGAEPRAAVAYAFAKGTGKPLRIAMDLEMSMKAGGMTLPPTKIPRMAMLFDLAAGDRQGGDWPIEGKLKTVTVEPKGTAEEQLAEALRPQLGMMSGFGMNYFVDAKGRVHDVKMTWPETMPAQAQQMMAGLGQSLESMTAPLPDEAIGTGAEWEVFGRLAANGADILQVSTFKLKERKGDVITLDVAVRQLAANSDVRPPGMPAGASARLLSFNAQGSGTSVLDTKDAAPVGGKMTTKSAMSVEIKLDVGGKPESQKTAIDTKVTVAYQRPAP
jgi:hypothetical protein